MDLQSHFGDRLWWRRVNTTPLKALCKMDGPIEQGASNRQEDAVLETVDIVLEDVRLGLFL